MADLSPADKSAVDAIVAASMAATKQPGVIVSITGPRGDYTKAYGKNLAGAKGRLLTTDDHFRMGSVTKTFTGLAFWRAVDAGLVSLTDTLETYVPGVPLGSTITMQQVLSMRSGVFEYTSDSGVLLKILLNPTGAFSEAEALDLIKSNPSQFAPGSKYAYANSNAILIGAVVEAVTGRDLRVIFKEDIFTPLGMAETAWPSNATIPAPAASTVQYNPEITLAAGCLTTTIGDLTKWAQAMRDGTLISSASQTARTSTFPSTGIANPGPHPPDTFAYGYFTFQFGSWIGHDGSITGSGTACAFDKVSGATITVNQNVQNNAAFYTILRNIANLLYPDSFTNATHAGLRIGATTSAQATRLVSAGANCTVQAVTTAALTHTVGAAGAASLPVNAEATAAAAIDGVAGAVLAVDAAASASMGSNLFAQADLAVVADAKVRGLLPLLYIPRNKVVVLFDDRRALVQR